MPVCHKTRAKVYVDVSAANMKMVEHLHDDPARSADILDQVRRRCLVVESPGASSRSLEIARRRDDMPPAAAASRVFIRSIVYAC